MESIDNNSKVVFTCARKVRAEQSSSLPPPFVSAPVHSCATETLCHRKMPSSGRTSCRNALGIQIQTHPRWPGQAARVEARLHPWAVRASFPKPPQTASLQPACTPSCVVAGKSHLHTYTSAGLPTTAPQPQAHRIGYWCWVIPWDTQITLDRQRKSTCTKMQRKRHHV
jgi:hypothetical protein